MTTPFHTPKRQVKTAVVTHVPEKGKDFWKSRFEILIENEVGDVVRKFTHIRLAISKGIVQLQDGSSGCGFSPFANIYATGSVRGMRLHGGWGKKDRVVRAHGGKYNIDQTLLGQDATLEILSYILMTQGLGAMPQTQGATTRIPLVFEKVEDIGVFIK